MTDQNKCVKLGEIIREFDLEILHEGANCAKVPLQTLDVNRPGLPLSGFFEHFDTQRLLVLEYTDRNFDRVELTAFLPVSQQDSVLVYPVVDTDAQYMLNDTLYSGKDLDRDGLKLTLGENMSAVRLCLKKVK